jgi:hypothetical protein
MCLLSHAADLRRQGQFWGDRGGKAALITPKLPFFPKMGVLTGESRQYTHFRVFYQGG